MIVLGNDTVVAITKPQLIGINRSLNDYEHLKEVIKVKQMELDISDSLVFYWKGVAAKSDSLYVLEAQKYDKTLNVNKALETELKKNKKRSRKINIGVGVGGSLLGFILGVLLIK